MPTQGLVRGVVWSSPRPVSTGQLHTLRCFHFRPINPLVWAGALPDQVGERRHLEASFPLTCFQRVSLPNGSNQQCTWRHTWHTSGPSVPLLSYYGQLFSSLLPARRTGTQL